MKPRFPWAAPSRADATILPAVLAGGLVAMAFGQAALTGPVELPAAGAVARGARAATLLDPPGSVVPGIIASRPIFAPSSAGAASDAAGAPPDPLDGTTIAGSVRIGRVRYVMVQPRGGAVRRVGVGGNVAGWRLAGIGASEALLVRGGERLRIAYGVRANTDGGGDASPQEDQQ